MADITVKDFDELDSSYEGAFMHAAKTLGVTSWGMNIERLPAGWADYPLHDHVGDGQEEVYVVLEGSVTRTLFPGLYELSLLAYSDAVARVEERTVDVDVQ